MNQECDGQDYGAELVEEQDRAESADCMSESRSPAGMAEAKNHSGQGQPKKSRHDGGVQVALPRREAPIVLRNRIACVYSGLAQMLANRRFRHARLSSSAQMPSV